MSEDWVPKKRRKKVIGVMSLNLAPLIDINANLLFFLIVANSVQEDRLQAGKEVELPHSSASTAEAGDLVSVVVSMNNISVNELNIRCRHRWLSLMTVDADRNPSLAGAFSVERVKLPITYFVFSGRNTSVPASMSGTTSCWPFSS